MIREKAAVYFLGLGHKTLKWCFTLSSVMLLSAWIWPAVVNAASIEVSLVTSERDLATGKRSMVPVSDASHPTVQLFAISGNRLLPSSASGLASVAKITASGGIAAFQNIGTGEYLLQVVAEGFIGAKKTVTVSGEAAEKVIMELRRPIDLGSPSLPRESFSGVNYAFGCNVVSLIFAQWQGQNTWTDALRQASISAATNGMNAFTSQAPEEAHFTSHVESLGTYTVTAPIGDTCGIANVWIGDILTQMGYTSGTVTERATQLARDRAAAACGSSPMCNSCGLQNSGFLFFIAREFSSPGSVGGWNCSGVFEISYFGRSDETVVYIHEIGHAFGTNDEYCTNLGGNNGMYCCGWPSGSNWGCTATGGCLAASNNNCDPLCGQNCTPSSGFTDCQDSCPASNCTTHTPCVMDGGATETFCNTSRKQLGWVDTDCDGALNCLETSCATDPNKLGSFPSGANCPARYSGIFVDSGAGGIQNGTSLFPFATVLQGYNAASAGSDINIRSGSYPEVINMNKRVNLKRWGCSGSATVGH